MRLPVDRRSAARNAIKIAARGSALIRNPALNKGTGFPLDERQAFGLEGLLPVRAKNQTPASRAHLSAAAQRARRSAEVRDAERAAESQRASLLPRARRSPRRADADRLHADRRRGRAALQPGVPGRRRHLDHAGHERPHGRTCCGASSAPARFACSSSPTTSRFSASATKAPAAWRSRKASSRCTRRRPASILRRRSP